MKSSILDPGSTKWGRIILLSLLLIPFSVSLFWSWNEAEEKLLLVVFYIYTLTLAFFVYKIWEKHSDKVKNAEFFGLIFDNVPTYEELKGGTPNLAPLFKLNEAYKTSNFTIVDAEGFEPPTSSV